MTRPAAGPAARPAPTRIGRRTFEWGVRTYVMGIVNVTPDSFSGDGLVAAVGSADAADALISAAVAQAVRMVDDGADILDVGGESTRPGHAPVQAGEELARVVPVVAAIHHRLPDVPISVDTTKSEVAMAALDAGAALLNDIWGVGESSLTGLAAGRRVPIVLMHNRGEARYDDVVAEVVADLRSALDRAIDSGVRREDVILDPGIGFGKTAEHNLAVLHHLERLAELGQPILLGTSRKSTIGKVLDLPAVERLEGTLATTALGIAAGVDIVRVHDVRANVRAARMADAIVRIGR
ncbi:MAG TPA: dihydropteroate synthase [Candidatus Limnocylindrales bacterium]